MMILSLRFSLFSVLVNLVHRLEDSSESLGSDGDLGLTLFQASLRL